MRYPLVAPLIGLVVMATGCGGSPAPSGTAGSGASSTPSGAASASQSASGGAKGATTGGSVKVRVVNLLGATIDVYAQDPRRGGPVITGLASGQASDYVAPPTLDQGSDLEPFKAGSTDRSDFGGISQGFTAKTQVTDVFFPTTDSSGTATFASHVIGDLAPLQDSSQSPVTPPAGQGIIIANGNPLTATSSQLSGFLEIDGSCQTAITDTGNSSKSPTYLTNGDNAYAVAPGSHQLAVVAFSGNPPTSCTGQTAAGTASASVDAGKRVEAIAFGSSPQDIHLLVLLVPGS